MKKGSKHSPEAIEKLRLSKIGITSPNKGKKLTEEWKKNLSDSHKGIKLSEEAKANLLYYATGEKNPNWKGGISSNKSYRNWQKNEWHHRERSADGTHNFGEWETLKVQYDFTCPSCKKSEPEIKLTLDHIIPLSKGGSNNIENIQPLCMPCNAKKHTKTIKY